MATLTLNISDAAYRQLERRAANEKLSVDLLVESLIQRSLPDEDRVSQEEIERKLAMLDEQADRASKRAHLYPPGFKLDDSRETIYGGPDGRGE